ncbi:D-tyr-tRNA(Tyr) deacylase [Nitrospira japonica]|uniref:D-aminoacyl-tRNA deacylase n=1 Tax=Nitrospira japonica TaxID=1325564 RepID=A0A1W1I267_9BACT|nr:D-aminoacyl-tRNA deacylase [Nitrospira japonica]SLM47106.1 D-tyr-tRNA(Tyr) deacylase [Nitrospira japonica]
MKAVVQRVVRARVEVDGETVGQIREGLLVLLGVAADDTEAAGRSLAEKLQTLRIFSDDRGKMNRSLADIGGSVLLVSQFTLLGNTKNGRRPSFEEAAPPEEAKRLYEFVIHEVRARGVHVETGVFAAHMAVESVNDGPVTFVLETR